MLKNVRKIFRHSMHNIKFDICLGCRKIQIRQERLRKMELAAHSQLQNMGLHRKTDFVMLSLKKQKQFLFLLEENVYFLADGIC